MKGVLCGDVVDEGEVKEGMEGTSAPPRNDVADDGDDGDSDSEEEPNPPPYDCFCGEAKGDVGNLEDDGGPPTPLNWRPPPPTPKEFGCGGRCSGGGCCCCGWNKPDVPLSRVDFNEEYVGAPDEPNGELLLLLLLSVELMEAAANPG